MVKCKKKIMQSELIKLEALICANVSKMFGYHGIHKSIRQLKRKTNKRKTLWSWNILTGLHSAYFFGFSVFPAWTGRRETVHETVHESSRCELVSK